MQNSHSDSSPFALPSEWGLRWWRSSSYRLARPGDPDDSFNTPEWCEGVFSGDDVSDKYNPVARGPEIFDAALSIVPDDNESTLAFFRAWGPLGTSPLRDNSVWAARRTFREIQRHFRWLQALSQRQWRSPAIPALWNDRDAFLTELRTVLPPPEHSKLDPPWFDSRWPDVVREAALSDLDRNRRTYPDPYIAAFVKGHIYAEWALTARTRDREEHHWRAFGWAIGEHLRSVNPALGWDAGRASAAWEIPRLVDLLWVQLWSLATGGAAIRQCRHCHRWFPVDHRGKIFCSRKCTNRASAKASYEARKKATPRRPRR